MNSQWMILGPATLYMMSMTLTPGPNNIMLTASGANFGFKRTLPHMAGIVGGCFLLFSAIALGLGTLFERFPSIQIALRWLGSAYLLYLAWKIASAPPPDLKRQAHSVPLTFWQAAAFQFANPKAWVMGLALIAGFIPEQGSVIVNALILVGFVELMAFPCLALWAGFGMAIGHWIKSDGAWRLFNVTMGLLTAACVVLILR